MNDLKLLKKFSPRASKILSNFSWLSFDSIFRMAISFSIGLWFARLIGPDNYGIYSFALSFIAIFSPFAKLGLDGILIRNLVKEPQKAKQYLGTTFLLKLSSSFFVAMISVIAIMIYQPKDKTTQLIVGIASLGTLFLAFDTIDFWFRSQVQSKYSVLAKGSSLLLVSVIRVIVLLKGGGIIQFALLSVVETALSGVMLVIIYQKTGNSIFTWKASFAHAKTLLKDSWPFILSGSFVLVYMRADQLFLKYFADNKTLGLYATAIRLSEIWNFIPLITVSSILPSITVTKQQNEKVYEEQLQKMFDLLAWVSILIAIILTLFSKQIIETLFGVAYLGASPLLSIYIWSGPFVFLSVARNAWVLNENKATFSLITTFWGATSNIILNYLLIPKWGGYGAAIATIVSYAINSHISCFFIPKMKHVGWMLTKALFIPLRFGQNITYIKFMMRAILRLREPK